MKLVKSLLALSTLLIPIIVFSSNEKEAETIIVEASMVLDEYVNEIVYPENEVIEVNISIDQSDLDHLIENASDELIYSCDITYNGITLYNVAIRAKGNSSLRSVVEENGDRFSYNIDLNYYIDQDLYGIDKLILNNLYMDPTMIAEYIAYEALDSLDATSSRTTFTALYINDEYYGLYLSVEQVGNEFLDANFGNSDGELYKPEINNGADLDYISDNRADYSGLINENLSDTSEDTILDLITAINTGEGLEEIFNVDGFLKYLAVSTFVVHLDSYQGGMFHNYYLYNSDGTYEWIAWDLNMAFNGFPMANLTDQEAIKYLIDEPTTGSLSNYPLIETILNDDNFLSIYHSYLQELIDNYFDQDTFQVKVLELYQLIDNYVKTDTNSFYTYQEFTDAIFTDSESQLSLLTFVNERSANVQSQLLGEIDSTNNGQGNISSSSQNPGQMPGNNVRPGQDKPGQGVIPIESNDPLSDTEINDEAIPSFNPMLIIGAVGILGFAVYLNKK